MTFDEACERLFKAEGFFSNHPLDNGGATMYGITMQMWGAYLKKPVSLADVMSIDSVSAKPFYMDMFWKPLRLAEVHNETLRYIIFDQGVNRGPPTVVKQLQSVLNILYKKGLKEDGVLGDETLKAINAADSGFALKFVCSSQLAYCRIVQARPSQLAFLAGWIKRTQELLTLIFQGGPK